LVFKLTPPAAGKKLWSEQILHGFSTVALGTYPYAGLAFDAAGNLYGTTSSGGANGEGTVFKLAPPKSGSGAWTETVLYSFKQTEGLPDIAGPLAVAPNGTLYGLTWYTAYSLTPPATGTAWKHTVLANFVASTGQFPVGGLTLDKAGNLYGVTTTGGKANAGTVFELVSPKWTRSELHVFTGGNDGADPISGVVLAKSGDLIGTAAAGGATGSGTIFQLTPGKTAPWAFTLLHSFSGAADGATPVGRLTLNTAGTAFGTTAGGGYSMPPSATNYCINPVSSLYSVYFSLSAFSYSATGCGSAFSLTPPAASTGKWTFTELNKFTGYGLASPGGEGAAPYGPVALDAAGNIYGTLGYNPGNGGAVFEITP
jgi:uncharacterized repeat protein (TIGR03803 family)